MLTLIYHKKLDADWETAAEKLAAGLTDTRPSFPGRAPTETF